MFCSTATTVAILQNAWSGAQPRHPRADCRSLGERGGMMSDDVILRRCPILHRIKKCSYGAYGAKDKPEIFRFLAH